MSEEQVIGSHQDAPITQSRIAADLRTLGMVPGMAVLVHTSLSALGWVCGGAVAVILALEEVVESYGIVMMPSHSGDLSDPASWENPPVPEAWWDEIRQTMPAYDPELTPTRGIGVVPEVFRKQADTVRSAHPTVSFAAWGEGAVDLVCDHALSNSLGEESPLARLYDIDGWVLLLGVGFDVNTSFHLAEYRADYATRETVHLGAPISVAGHRRWRTYDDINYSSDDFEAIGDAFLHRHGHEVSTGLVGHATARLFPQRLCVDFAVDWVERHRR